MGNTLQSLVYRKFETPLSKYAKFRSGSGECSLTRAQFCSLEMDSLCLLPSSAFGFSLGNVLLYHPSWPIVKK